MKLTAATKIISCLCVHPFERFERALKIVSDEIRLKPNREEAEGQLLSAPLLFVRHPLNTGEQQLGLILVFNPD